VNNHDPQESDQGRHVMQAQPAKQYQTKQAQNTA
jgi:hypothetical protein